MAQPGGRVQGVPDNWPILERSLHRLVYLPAVSAELAADGLLVPGRSAPDRGRQVKSPAMSTWVQAGMQLRHLASALGLSPDPRGRSGIKEIEPIDDEDSDLLTSPAGFLT